MSRDSAIPTAAPQETALAAQRLYQHLFLFLAPLLQTLEQRLDVRLVHPFLATLGAIIQWRNRPHGLLLSELGAYLATPGHAPAATKRLSNLLRSSKWTANLLANWLWKQATTHVQTLRTADDEPLLIWDGSVLEKRTATRVRGCALFVRARPGA